MLDTSGCAVSLGRSTSLLLLSQRGATRPHVLDDLYELDREALPALPDGDVVELGDFGEQGRWPRRGGGTGRAFPVRVAVATDRPGGHGCAPGQSADPGHMRRGKALPLITVPG